MRKELKDTYALMVSHDWKDNFKAEYYQLKIRHKETEYKVNHFNSNLVDKHGCKNELLLYQVLAYKEEHMRQYLKCMKSLAEQLDIDLEEE